MTLGACATRCDPGLVVLAMSGGVDSSVAAKVLQDQGWQVIGLHLRMFDGPAGHGPDDAALACQRLGIDLQVRDVRDTFRQSVIRPFVAEYAAGRTPNPCALCNPTVKFASLLQVMHDTGANAIATGHYAAMVLRHGIHMVARPADRLKDQSYFLFGLDDEVRAHVVFPLASMTKADVRAKARELLLSTADAPESLDICFVPGGDYRDFLTATGLPGGATPGVIVDADGQVLGCHDGIHRFTVGQRRGLGIARGERVYVTAIDARSGRVTIGPRHARSCSGMQVRDCIWAVPWPSTPFNATVMVRYQDPGREAEVIPGDFGRVQVRFKEPDHPVTPGQAAVFYQDDAVIGGGFIAAEGDE